MRVFALYKSELRRLLLSKTLWAAVLLSCVTPLVGYAVTVYNSGMSDIYIRVPVVSAALCGSVIWAVLTMTEAGRLHRSGMGVLADAAASPRVLAVAGTLAVLTVSAATTVLCACLYLPYTASKMEYLFHAPFYIANFLVFVLPTWWGAVLLAEGIWQITRRVELTVLLFALPVCSGLGSYAQNDYFMRWLNPRIISYSDGFISWWPLRMGLYTRMIWLCFAASVWVCGLACMRRYEKNLFRSWIFGLRKCYFMALAVVFLLAGAGLWTYQPFINQEPERLSDENTIVEAPAMKTDAVRYSLRAEPLSGQIRATAEYDIRQPYTGENRLLLNPGYQIRRMTYGKTEIDFRTENDDQNGVRSTYFTLPDIPDQTLTIVYCGMPQIRRPFAAAFVDLSVDCDYIQLSGEAIAPFLNIEDEKGATLMVTIPGHLTPYTDHMPMTEWETHADGTRTWKMEQAGYGGYIRDFAAGNYTTDTFSAAGNEIHFVYGKAYEKPVKQYDIQSAVQAVFEYCTKHYGALAFAQDNIITLHQVSGMLMGGQAGGGYVEWYENVLSPMTLGDTDKGASASEVFIHEMIHQWWGGYGLQCDMSDELWSEEGLTVYATYRLVKEAYGEMYAKQYYVDEWKKAVKNQERNFYNRFPQYLDRLPETYRTELVMENNGINQYMRMPLMILKAQQLVGGEEQMDQILKKMYADRELFYEEPFTYQDFLDYCGLTAADIELDAEEEILI